MVVALAMVLLVVPISAGGHGGFGGGHGGGFGGGGHGGGFGGGKGGFLQKGDFWYEGLAHLHLYRDNDLQP